MTRHLAHSVRYVGYYLFTHKSTSLQIIKTIEACNICPHVPIIYISIIHDHIRVWKDFLHYWPLTHWGRVTHICVSNLTTIGSVNGLSPARRQAITWTNGGILLIRPLGTNFSEILIEISTFSFKKMRLKISSAKWRPFCLGLNVLSQGSLMDSPHKDQWCGALAFSFVLDWVSCWTNSHVASDLRCHYAHLLWLWYWSH